MKRAHTLMELLVVITLLLLAVGIAMPYFMHGWSTAQMNSAAAAIRNNFGFARTRAVASGVRHQLLIEPEAGTLIVQAFRPDEQANASATQQAGQELPVLEYALPERVRVTEWTVEPMGYAAQNVSQTQSEVVTFYAEGRSDNALVVLETDTGERRGVELNGFTGEITELNELELRERTGTVAGGR
ncbi:MAG: hypothetical protein ACO1SX_21115 [Actinomycetota bacterium]